MKQLDDRDRKIIAVLQKEARINMHELADAVGLSATPCTRRVKQMEDAGIIKGYSAIIDQAKVGLPISAFASIKLEKQTEDNLDRFAATVGDWREVVDCYLMTGQFDYLLRIVVSDLPAYEAFLKTKLTRLKGVASIETSFALAQMKRSEVIPC